MNFFAILFLLCIGICFGLFLEKIASYYCDGKVNDTSENEVCEMEEVTHRSNIFPSFSPRGRTKDRRRKFLFVCFGSFLFAVTYVHHGLSANFLIQAFFWSVLLLIGWIDYHTLFIYDSMLGISFIFFLIMYVFILPNKWMNHFVGLLGCFLVFFMLHVLTKIVYKREVFGFGDVLLNALFGFYFGAEYLFAVCILPFYIASFVFIAMKLFKKGISSKLEIPFAPFMCFSAGLISLFGEKVHLLFPDVVKLFFS